MSRNHEPTRRAFVPDLPDHRDDEYHGGGAFWLIVCLAVWACIGWWVLA